MNNRYDNNPTSQSQDGDETQILPIQEQPQFKKNEPDSTIEFDNLQRPPYDYEQEPLAKTVVAFNRIDIQDADISDVEAEFERNRQEFLPDFELSSRKIAPATARMD